MRVVCNYSIQLDGNGRLSEQKVIKSAAELAKFLSIESFIIIMRARCCRCCPIRHWNLNRDQWMCAHLKRNLSGGTREEGGRELACVS